MMDCAECEHAERRADGELVCGFTGAAVPPLDDRPGLYCAVDLPIGDPSARDAIAAILLAAEKRGRLGKLLAQYSQADRWRLWAIAEEWLSDAVREAARDHNPMHASETPQPHAHVSAVDSSAKATQEPTG